MTARLYHELARYWPIVCPPEDYQGEADWVLSHAAGKSILELGAGAGGLSFHLAQKLELTAVDIAAPLLELARKNVPGAAFVEADMRTLQLDRTFDTVVAVDALEYMLSESDLLAAFKTAAAHLASGGRLLAASTYLTESFVPHETGSAFHQSGDIEVVTISHVDHHPSGSGIVLDVALMIREREMLNIEPDRQHCGLFDRATWRCLLEEAGFNIDAEEDGEAATMFIASRR